MTIETLDYRPPIPQELDQRYRTALSQVLRWQGGTIPSDIEESNLDHVIASLEISKDIKDRYTNLARDVDFSTVDDMIYLHDAGEIITGDLCLSRPDFDAVKNGHKHREKAAMRYLIKGIDDPNLRKMVDELARRYQRNDPSDCESQMARLIDKIQALHFGLVNVYPSPSTNEEKVHVARAVSLIESVVGSLSPILRSEGKEELKTLISEQWDLIKRHGFIV